MTLIALLLNIPWSLIGILTAILSIPRKIEFSKNPPAIIFYINSSWWYSWFPGKKGSRGSVNGNVVRLGSTADHLDLKHELIHVEQFMRFPFAFGFLMLYEQIKSGFDPIKNKFEKEAYEKSGSRYLGKS